MTAYIRRVAGGVKRRVRRLRQRWMNPIDATALDAALREALPAPCNGVLVHSSLARCGYFVGGHQMVVSALLRRSDNLCMPTHSYCYPASRAVQAPLFDPAETPSVVGALTNAFWRMDGVVRSLHPTHSLAATGPLAGPLTAGHETCGTPCGDGTPYAKMIDAGFAVLMLGASLDGYTLFHTAEHFAKVPYLYEPEPYDLRVREGSGRDVPVRMLRQDMTIPRRFAEMDSELEAIGLLRRVPIGQGQVLCIANVCATHEFLVGLLRRDPWHLVQRQG